MGSYWDWGMEYQWCIYMESENDLLILIILIILFLVWV